MLPAEIQPKWERSFLKIWLDLPTVTASLLSFIWGGYIVQHVKVMDALQNFFFVRKLHSICWNLQPFHWAAAELALLGIQNLLSVNKLNEWIKYVLGRAQGFTGEMQSSPAATWLRPRGSFSFLRCYKKVHFLNPKAESRSKPGILWW